MSSRISQGESGAESCRVVIEDEGDIVQSSRRDAFSGSNRCNLGYVENIEMDREKKKTKTLLENMHQANDPITGSEDKHAKPIQL